MLTVHHYIKHENVERFMKCLSTEIDLGKQTILVSLEPLRNRMNWNYHDGGAGPGVNFKAAPFMQ